MPTVLVISLSDLGSDPRVDRQIDFLRAEHRVVAAGFGPSAYEDVEFVELGRTGVSAPFRLVRRATRLATGILRLHRLACWSEADHSRWRRALNGVGADVLVVNDTGALPLAFAVSRGAPVVFDAHEYSPAEFETSRLWRLLDRPHVRWTCRRYLPRVAGMMAVSKGIADRYERDHGVRPAVVTNAARFETLEPTGVDDPIRLVHFGWPDPQRRLADTIDAIGRLDTHYSIDLFLKAGASTHRHLEKLMERAAGDPRIRFLNPVPMRELPRVANDYDVGVHLLPPASFNQEHALPNKFFEYIQGRIVPAIGPSPEMARIVREWDCGIVAEDYTPEAFATAVADTSRERLAELKGNVDRAAHELCAERNAPIVLDVVARALDEAASPTGYPGLPSAGAARASR
jgi:glycosyltransferase involved in cell wall biosynthesis